jgi:hypothetical protein
MRKRRLATRRERSTWEFAARTACRLQQRHADTLVPARRTDHGGSRHSEIHEAGRAKTSDVSRRVIDERLLPAANM